MSAGTAPGEGRERAAGEGVAGDKNDRAARENKCRGACSIEMMVFASSKAVQEGAKSMGRLGEGGLQARELGALTIGVGGNDVAINRKGWVEAENRADEVVQRWVQGVLMGACEGCGSMVCGGVLWSRGGRREEEFCVKFRTFWRRRAGRQRHAVCGRGGTRSVEKR